MSFFAGRGMAAPGTEATPAIRAITARTDNPTPRDVRVTGASLSRARIPAQAILGRNYLPLGT
jgi:hypothetical protein